MAEIGREQTMARVAVVTGASSGIGEATVHALLGAGWRVYAGARRVERMQALVEAGARVLALDVTQESSMRTLRDTVLAEAGRIDALVNNAGYGSYGAIEEVPLQEGRRQFDVNVFGLARMVQLVLPAMREARRGRIVNIASIGGKIHEPLGGWYHATKFAVEGFSDCLRMELAPFGIDVVVVEPGAIRTEWNAIARAGLRQHSGRGPYAAQAARQVALMAAADASVLSSSPRVVARGVLRALTAHRPRTRYAVGGGARSILLLRRFLPDRTFDALMRAVARGARMPAL
jgi:NAD(P)-dependent dehydrogenase (short-subunit alcohol dehydrogenase family)